MAKYTVPGIRQQEIDNSIQTESAPGLGIGAIVMKSNKGPVNQRIVTTNYGEFTEIFGLPETRTDYGHFAAENYFANSTQLFSVRATMGDEQYAQIQFPYPDASVTAKNISKDSAVFKYVDNQEDPQLKVLQPLTDIDSLTATEWNKPINVSENLFNLTQKARWYEFNDIYSQSTDSVIYKSWVNEPSSMVDIQRGIHVKYPTTTDKLGNMSNPESRLVLTEKEWTSHIDSTKISVSNNITDNITRVTITVPASGTMNNIQTNISFMGNYETVSSWPVSGTEYTDVFTNNAFAYGDKLNNWETSAITNESVINGYCSAYNLTIMDWDDPNTPKTYTIDALPFDNAYETQTVSGLTYTDYGTVDKAHVLIGAAKDVTAITVSAVSTMYKSDDQYSEDDPRTCRQVINDLMNEYGISDISDVNNCTYIRFNQIVPVDAEIERFVTEPVDTIKQEQIFENLFYLIQDQTATKPIKVATFSYEKIEDVNLPNQEGRESDGMVLNNIVAQPTSYLVNSVDKTYADGYTIKTETEDEPGNGDIENYNSIFDNQLVIASIGPGEYGNDIGVSIITTACADVKALQHQNAFNWKNKYDDDDLVEKDGDDLTWKKVFRINVYAKSKNQTAEGAWGTGMDALLRDPIESWWVSTDPYAKDENGGSLYAPTVINGHSDYIYVSRSSVTKAMNCKGTYEQPLQTYSIFQLTGGKNSVKDNISEKTAALSFYTDRQKADFDILFNVDVIDTFNGKQRYAAHQKRIAEIAAARKMDIGVVQVTSKSAKSCKQMLSESKMFAFNNGTYVAEYAGYDKYFNSTLSTAIFLPKSVAGACAMARCDTFHYPWMAPAGTDRGAIPYSNAQLLRLTDDEIGQLYINNVNTTRDCGQYGVVLWGQKTALKKNSLLNRINIRRCLNYIQKNLENMLTPYLWAQNSINIRSSARNDIDSFLQRVMAADGLYGYELSVSQDNSDDTIMNVNIILYPVSAIEFIDVKMYINRQGITNVTEEYGTR